MTVGAPATHLRSVRWEPADLQALAHPHFGQKLAEQQDALSAESRDPNGYVLSRMAVMSHARSCVPRIQLKDVRNRPARWILDLRHLRFAIAKHVERKWRDYFLRDP